jgi:hypothetical protein
MLKAYVDDSHVGDKRSAAYVLAGWCAPARDWLKFSDDWNAVLRMNPRIRYFKFDEAMNFNGEFNGLSEPSRNEKIKLLVNVLAEHAPLGMASILPTRIYEGIFGQSGPGVMRNPYGLLFFGVVGRLVRHYNLAGVTPQKIDFIFDYQPGGKMGEIQRGWDDFIKWAPEADRKFLHNHPPSFLDDKQIVALQAADLHAGWVHMLDSASLIGQPIPQPLWGQSAGKLTRVYWEMTEDWAEGLFQQLYGYKPIRFGYTFGYGYRP